MIDKASPAHRLEVIEGDREVTLKQGDLEFVVGAPIALGYDEVWDFGADAVGVERIHRTPDGEVDAVSEVSDVEAARALTGGPKLIVKAKSRVRREIREKGLVAG